MVENRLVEILLSTIRRNVLKSGAMSLRPTWIFTLRFPVLERLKAAGNLSLGPAQNFQVGSRLFGRKSFGRNLLATTRRNILKCSAM